MISLQSNIHRLKCKCKPNIVNLYLFLMMIPVIYLAYMLISCYYRYEGEMKCFILSVSIEKKKSEILERNFYESGYYVGQP